MSGGDLATVRELAEKNLAALEKYQADYIMTACATCGGALHKFYPSVVGKRNPELLKRLQAVADKTIDASVLLQKLGFNPEGTGAGEAIKITYHDPCHLRTQASRASSCRLRRAYNWWRWRGQTSAAGWVGHSMSITTNPHCSSMPGKAKQFSAPAPPPWLPAAPAA